MAKRKLGQPYSGYTASRSNDASTSIESEHFWSNKRRKDNGKSPQDQRESHANGLVPHYTKKDEVPVKLQKYWFQRKRFFSKYDEGCLLDEEGWYSVTPEKIALQIAERCRSSVVLDAFCGVGGNAIAFARTCEFVVAIDNSPLRLSLARHNAQLYGVADRIEFILADLPSFLQSYQTLPQLSKRQIDVVFLSPPWGGPSYMSSPSKQNPSQDDQLEFQYEFPLENITPLPGEELFALARTITPHVAFYLPRNVDLKAVSGLLASMDESKEQIEVEEEWMSGKLKALTCYFGGLVAGQEHLWTS